MKPRTTLLTALALTAATAGLRAAEILNQYDPAADAATPAVIEDQVGSMNFGATNVTRVAAAATTTTFTQTYELAGTAVGDGARTTPFFNPTSQNHSYEIWVRPGALDATYQVIFETGAQGNGTGILINSTEIRALQCANNIVDYDLTVPLTAVNTGDFVQITVVVDDTNDALRLYVKAAAGGDEFREDTVGTIGTGNNDAGLFSPGSNNTNTLMVGNVGGVGNPNIIPIVAKFTGRIALLNVYDDALTAAEVEAAFDARIASGDRVTRIEVDRPTGGVELDFISGPGTYTVTGGGDLSAFPDLLATGTATPPVTTVNFTDPAAQSSPRRFYRVETP